MAEVNRFTNNEPSSESLTMIELNAQNQVSDPEVGARDTKTSGSPSPPELEKQNETSQNVNWDWDEDPANPYNWPAKKKVLQVAMAASAAFAALVSSLAIISFKLLPIPPFFQTPCS